MKKILVLLSLLCNVSWASNCPDLYPDSNPIVIKNTIELCNTFYVVVFDEVNNRPVFASERLKKNSSVGSVDRIGAFKADTRVKSPDDLKAYIRSGYDKGHLVPADDGSTVDEVKETYFLTNVTPQAPELNRGSWKKLELSIRKIFDKANADLYVVTIPIYPPNPLLLANKIPVPTGYWKIVVSSDNERFFYADNLANSVVKEYTINWKLLLPKR